MQITVVPTVTHSTASPADHDKVNNPVRVQLTLELAVNAEHAAGTVRSGDRPAMPFSGLSELFAALVTVASDAGQDARSPPKPFT
jgi:hypothetical protein